MAIVKPFKGIRPPKELVEEVESRPYDVLDSEEARAEAGDNEKSLSHLFPVSRIGRAALCGFFFAATLAAEDFIGFRNDGFTVAGRTFT